MKDDDKGYFPTFLIQLIEVNLPVGHSWRCLWYLGTADPPRHMSTVYVGGHTLTFAMSNQQIPRRSGIFPVKQQVSALRKTAMFVVGKRDQIVSPANSFLGNSRCWVQMCETSKGWGELYSATYTGTSSNIPFLYIFLCISFFSLLCGWSRFCWAVLHNRW